MAQHPRHPDQFIEEFCRPSDKTFIEQPPIFAKDFSGIAKFTSLKMVTRPSSRITGSKAHHASATKWTGRHSANPDRLVNVFLQIHVERMLQQTRIP